MSYRDWVYASADPNGPRPPDNPIAPDREGQPGDLLGISVMKCGRCGRHRVRYDYETDAQVDERRQAEIREAVFRYGGGVE